MTSQQLKKLRTMFGHKCHYCDCDTVSTPRARKEGTREHIVPRAFGGMNILDNYVLACAECNNERGTQLFFCRCDVCAPKIQAALHNPYVVEKIIKGIVRHNTPKVRKNKNGVWEVQFYHGRKHFVSWSEAIKYANSEEWSVTDGFY